MIIRWLRLRNSVKSPDVIELQEQHEEQEKAEGQEGKEEEDAKVENHGVALVDDERESASLLQSSA